MKPFFISTLPFMKPLFALCLLSISVVAFSAIANSDLDTQNQKLKQLQAQIKQQREAIQTRLKEKDSLQDQFQAAELKVAEFALKIKQTKDSLAAVNRKIKSLEDEQTQLDKDKQAQQKVLSEMIRTAYLNGRHDYTKLLLNQEDPAQLERLITYYRKLNDARVQQLNDLQATLTRLQQIEVEQTQVQQQLAELRQAQEQDRKTLLTSQLEHKAALKKLNANIRSGENKLEQLQMDEQRLTNAIARARENAQRNPENLAGLYNLKKKLKWPTRGRLKHKFGQRRSGALRWKGVTIDGRLGNAVNVIADGVVLYADWLKGFGWVTVIDHGKGYMSLYGHNQALLKQAGEFVEQGEPISLVGQSGGQSEAGLYFEIRYKGETVNPARWCR